MYLLPPLTVFDVETTGLDPRKGHRIIEIAGIRVENGVIDESKSFVSLVNPERPIPWEAKRVNKISDEDVSSAPTIDQVLPEFLAFAAGSVLVAHNATFDLGFMEHEKEFCWGYLELPECLCTMKLSQSVYPGEFYHNLDALSRRLKLPMPAHRHRALPDVLLTAQAMLHMISQSRAGSLDDLKKLAGVSMLQKTK